MPRRIDVEVASIIATCTRIFVFFVYFPLTYRNISNDDKFGIPEKFSEAGSLLKLNTLYIEHHINTAVSSSNSYLYSVLLFTNALRRQVNIEYDIDNDN